MQGLELTYQTLATTRNEAAVEVLIAALDDQVAAIRGQALAALLSRGDSRSPQQLLANWDRLHPDGLPTVRAKKAWMAETIDQALRGGGSQLNSAMAAAEAIGLTTAVPQLTLLAESNASRAVRRRAVGAVLSLVAPLGRDARADRDQPTVRGPVLARLADSVRRFSMHRNEQLVDAFLLVSTWSDADLRQMISDNGSPMDLICKRLANSELPDVIELLAGFLRRRHLSPRIGELIQSRADEAFREGLLRVVGTEPTATVLRNLRELGVPKSCRGGAALLTELAPEARAALVHLYGAANSDAMENLHLITAAIELGGPACEQAAAIGLARCEVGEEDLWMRAAMSVADGDEHAIAANENACLLNRLIELLDHREPGIVRGTRRVLGPLHAEAMLHRFESLRPRSRRRLGRVVMMIDSDAVQRTRDALRHPVLSRRLEAIAMADALAIVDLLADSFAHISREDHQEARIRAAAAMADASGEETLKLLVEMLNLPESPVRDAAVDAFRRRRCEGVR